MKLSGTAAEAFVSNPRADVWCVLVFCEDEGVANDAANRLAQAWAGGEPFEKLSLTEDDISKSPGHFVDTLEARSLLGEQRIVTIRLSNEKLSRHFVDVISAGDTSTGRYESKLILISGSLKKSSKLRKSTESATHSAALQFFADTDADIREMVGSHLHEKGIGIEDSALELFSTGLPNDRRLVRAEMEKLATYAHNLDRQLTVSDIEAISASGTEARQHELIANALGGHAGMALSELDRLETVGTSPISLLRGFQREAERLLSAHEQGVTDPNSAMKLRPPVWRAQWPVFRTNLRIWSPPMLLRLLARIRDCEADAKRSGGMAGPATRHLVADILRLASSRK